MKIWNDTLKNEEGKYSRKSLTALTSFLLAILIGLYLVTVHLYSDKEPYKHAIDVFYSFLALGGGTLVLTVIDKIKNLKKS